MRLAIVGATGLVGRKMLQVLEERQVKVDELLPAASDRSAGQAIGFRGNQVGVKTVQQVLDAKPDAALFSAGGATSLHWAPLFAKAGITVIDNSSAWRMGESIPLVVPEVNAHVLTPDSRIIANPNCSTIQLVVALKPLHDLFHLKRLVITTFQAVTGTGVKGVDQLENERRQVEGETIYPHPIHNNVLPQCDAFTDNAYTKEEMKLVNESRKILELPDLAVTATCVRVPVTGGHSESVNIGFYRDVTVEAARTALERASGLVMMDDPERSIYPMPINCHDKDDVFVGRLRQDFSQHNTLNLWVVADNLRKGAATNAVQILETLIDKKLL